LPGLADRIGRVERRPVVGICAAIVDVPAELSAAERFDFIGDSGPASQSRVVRTVPVACIVRKERDPRFSCGALPCDDIKAGPHTAVAAGIPSGRAINDGFRSIAVAVRLVGRTEPVVAGTRSDSAFCM
jgi:hypothetical protein